MNLSDGERQVPASTDHYQRFYPIAHASAAHARFCERVYGADRCQDGQTDMACFADIVKRLRLQPGDQALDVGCGAGGLAEELSERTGARVTGIDNSASAIATAQARTIAKRDRLMFMQADMNALDLAAHAFDGAMAIDSISWATDLTGGLSTIARTIRPGGHLCIAQEQRVPEGDSRATLEANNTPVARALSTLHLRFECVDHTAALRAFWPLARETAAALRDAYVQEGTEFVCDTWITYADQIFLPAIAADRIRRYLYDVRV